MKPLVGLLVALGFLFNVSKPAESNKNWTLLIVGGTEGYLSPCGCTSPMSGGIKRRITALKSLTVPGRTTIIDNGPLVSGHSRQDQIKAETLAEAMALVNVDVTHIAEEEFAMGVGTAETIERLSRGAIVSLQGFGVFSGPFFVVGELDSRSPDKWTSEENVSRVLEVARENFRPMILMFRGDADAAKKIAQRNPGLALIVCTRSGSPFPEPLMVGDTMIVTPGEHGKYVVKIEWDGSKFTAYQAFDLGPEFPDDPEASEIYANYLARVAREDLISMVPRRATEDFAGSASCAPCHNEATEIWKKSAHARALATLEHEGHDKDPDCVACHVVGLDSIQGFRDRKSTPNLTDVGCESCHGPSRAHAMNPPKNKLPKVGERSCAPCHNTAHSPNFRFEDYWPRIAH